MQRAAEDPLRALLHKAQNRVSSWFTYNLQKSAQFCNSRTVNLAKKSTLFNFPRHNQTGVFAQGDYGTGKIRTDRSFAEPSQREGCLQPQNRIGSLSIYDLQKLNIHPCQREPFHANCAVAAPGLPVPSLPRDTRPKRSTRKGNPQSTSAARSASKRLYSCILALT